MDLKATAAFFDTQSFDVFNVASGTWALAAFKGQIKLADTFVSIWNRPTRKRMLFVAPGQEPTGSIIRLPTTGEIMMVGSEQGDSTNNYAYRKVFGLHKARGVAQLYRREPPQPGLGFAVNTLIQTTYADAELRSVNEDQDQMIDHFGHYFLFLPSNAPVKKNDTLVLDGITYFILEDYLDSGLRCARATSNPDERFDFVYTAVGNPVYNPVTQTNSPTTTNYNVTGKITPYSTEDLENTDLQAGSVRVMIHEDWIAFAPKPNDYLTYLGNRYYVKRVERNARLSEWVLGASQ